MLFNALTCGEREFVDNGMKRAALFLGNERSCARGRLFDSLQAAVETLVRLIRELSECFTEGVEAALLGLPGELCKFAGRDGTEGALNLFIEPHAARMKGAFDQPPRHRSTHRLQGGISRRTP